MLGDLPAVAETIPGFDFSGWFMLMAPEERDWPKVWMSARSSVSSAAAESARPSARVPA